MLKKWLEQENRAEVLQEIYNLSQETLEKIIAFGSPEKGQTRKDLYDRCMFAREFGVDCSVMRLLLDYNRYDELFKILNFLGDINFSELKVLDYGCGASDYGFCFTKLGSYVTFYDLPEMLVCPKLRLEKMSLTGKFVAVPEPVLNEIYDLIIFSESLEHLENPLQTLKECKTKFLFSSSYPYIPVDSTYFNKSGHSPEAHNQVLECQKFLKNHYDYFDIQGKHMHKIKASAPK